MRLRPGGRAQQAPPLLPAHDPAPLRVSPSASRTGALFVSPSSLGQFPHHDAVALDLVQIELDRCGRLGRRRCGTENLTAF
jgi:hypothetical protein